MERFFGSFLSFLVFIVVKVKMSYNIWVGTYGNRIDKLGKMVWPQFTTKVLQITILDIDDCDKIRVDIQKEIHL